MEIIKPGREFDFMGKRKYFLGLSLLLLILSAIFFYTPGPKLGTDFRGGTEVELAFKQDVGDDDIRSAVGEAGFSRPDVIRITDSDLQNHFVIRIQEVSEFSPEEQQAAKDALCFGVEGENERCPANLIPTEVKFSPGGDRMTARYSEPPNEEAIPKIRELMANVPGVELRPGNQSVGVANNKVEILLKSEGEKLVEALQKTMGPEVAPETALRIQWIGPKAGAALRDSAIKSIVIAVFFIMAYIAFRFDMRFAPGSIVALIHDVSIAMGAVVITQRDITLTTVAAMLTIVGYSINDTVVVFDRIRENLGKYRGMTFPKIINLSVSEMLGRTITTSGLTAMSMFSFLYFGTGLIKDFAFALLVGVLVGTYSSIYIAAPVTEFIDRKFFGGKTSKPRAKVRRTRAAKRAETVV